ncbi:hypothetical protein [Roseibium sp. RKSG952]|uniref:hypothetical protein n=1 Tax=Roseibium sp. RKSG952 TaxID=2529384 RepID=UPI0012BD401A|nr:hypothetical protein [Roseibium sp. RKSG952]MTH94785.1 hypothetical protein [Roseibium sp. RKSG952]
MDIAEVAPEAAPCVLKTGFEAYSDAYHKFDDAFWCDHMNEANTDTCADIENCRLPSAAASVFEHELFRAMGRDDEHAFDHQAFDAVSLEPRDAAILSVHEKSKNLIVVGARVLARKKSEPVMMFVKGIDEDLQDAISGIVGDPLDYTGDGIVQIFSVNTEEEKIHKTLEEQGWDLVGKSGDQKSISWVEVIDPDAFTENIDLRNFLTNIRDSLQEIGWSVSIEARRENEEARKIRALTQKALLINDESPNVADQLESSALEVSSYVKNCCSHSILGNSRLREAVNLMEKAVSRWTNDKDASPAPAM